MHRKDVFRFLQHLTFRNPEGGFCHRHGEVVDLDAVELGNRNLDRKSAVSAEEGNLAL